MANYKIYSIFLCIINFVKCPKIQRNTCWDRLYAIFSKNCVKMAIKLSYTVILVQWTKSVFHFMCTINISICRVHVQCRMYIYLFMHTNKSVFHDLPTYCGGVWLSIFRSLTVVYAFILIASQYKPCAL